MNKNTICKLIIILCLLSFVMGYLMFDAVFGLLNGLKPVNILGDIFLIIAMIFFFIVGTKLLRKELNDRPTKTNIKEKADE